MPDARLDVEIWRGVIESLEEFLPYYEKVNNASTFFQLGRWRSRAMASVDLDEEVLEIGPGAGGFARLLDCYRTYLLEPSVAILSYSTRGLDPIRYVPLAGVAEDIPLRNESVDRVFCIFSFRDFMDKALSLGEIHRVLRPGGMLHVVDLFRAPEGPRRRLMELWLAAGAPRVLRTLVPRQAREAWVHDPYRELLLTYHAVGEAAEYEVLMREAGFTNVTREDLLLRSVCHLQGEKPSST